MKTFFLNLTMLFVSMITYAQTNYNGKIYDQENQPLSGVTIQSIAENKAVVTDNNGNFEINLTNVNNVKISYLGFKTQEISLTKKPNKVILLIDENELQEIVISASREQQKRSEVPAAISVISAKKIDNTKAFGIDQLVNDVPGVQMVTSRAASNEQHFMSVRSPISTKALFLFLEDGLPIRPTSVFNHNALLEMNDITYDRIEALKGPASSIYGSEAIGGSFNFITKDPTKKPSGHIGFQGNDLGFSNVSLDYGEYASEKVGFYAGAQFSQRNNGPIEHSDYEKFAFTFKNVFHITDNLNWTTVFDAIDYRSDMTGSLSEADYQGGNFESDQTFTERDATAYRLRTTLEQKWNANNKTTFNAIFRDNRMDQNPSYRVRQTRDKQTGQLTGTGTGEINSNKFKSYAGLLQHKISFDFLDANLILGASLDFSPQDYVSEKTNITVNVNSGKNTDFTIDSGNFNLNYEADILNYAGYTQFELSPVENLKITAGVRYDNFTYDFKNRIEKGAIDAKDSWDNFAPKIGANYNFSSNSGIYLNFSSGFTPPQTSTLYRSRDQNEGLKPSRYENYEIGTYLSPVKGLRIDVALYKLDGKNTLVTLRDTEKEAFVQTNAGETESYGIEYGISYKPISEIEISHNGTYSKHRYKKFFAKAGRNAVIDYSDTDRETAPNLSGTSKVRYTPNFAKGLAFTVSHELVGEYNTSLEGQAKNDEGNPTTETYNGHSIFNGLVAYKFKHFEVWAHALNIFDKLYSNRASYSTFSNQNTYTIGNPRAFHLGIKYNF